MAQKKEKVLIAAVLTAPFTAFGVSSKSLSSSMVGIHLFWNGDVLVVTSDHHKEQERWVFPGNIAELVWKEPEA